MFAMMHGPKRGGFGPPGREFLARLGFDNPRFGGRSRGRRNRGDVRTAVLALLREQPMHGYQIIQEITDRTDGTWRPSPGSVYPTVSQLADEGLVRTEKAGGRTTVHLTEHGHHYTEQHRDDLDAVWNTVSAGVDDDAAELRTAGRALLGAAAQVAHVGNADQLAEATRLLNDTRRRLYLLLADDTPDEPGDDHSTTQT